MTDASFEATHTPCTLSQHHLNQIRLELQRQQESRRRAIARRRARETLRPRSPPPVDGRRHTEVQTELYLEEITDRVEETEVATQTDAFLDRPPTPLFVPAKIGRDVATQIEEGDLFHFDLEVQPILEVLVGKTVEQALLEVMEEEELAALRQQQRVFEENRNAEMVEMQRLEEQERRRREEKERRMQQKREALLKEKETAEKVAARAFAQSYLSDLLPSVFSNLNQGGFFYDPVEREVEGQFLPWLMDETVKVLDQRILARALLDSLIAEVVMRKLGIEPPKTPQPDPTTEAPPTTTDPAPLSTVEAPNETATPTEVPPIATEAPPTTTEAPPTTIEAPPTTTEAPPTTTEAPPTTTEPPPTTAEAPPTTTEPPPTTAEAPPTTTEAPPTTTEAPPTTTEPPPTTAEVPPTTAEAPPTTAEIDTKQQSEGDGEKDTGDSSNKAEKIGETPPEQTEEQK
ncbi:Radial spoke head protein 3 homolog [Geodia barretti]|uniref:Radial spoke head protein 3 homolog n=1 Tax=Geodia barretti TaxID=519541 RepID=A0AA35T166_GEOBA|nr:Radial spoke head protein 3 homolog [Geodia barretti]